MARVELNEQDMEEVVGGAFHWSYDSQGAKKCHVDGVGDFSVTTTAKDRYIALKLEHKLDGWTGADYVNVLVEEGYFTPYQG
ncbi:MAG: hypothetical protein IKR85_07810 [Clostridia bacterium]|nr:hypothetical protein [Clostridia bacterium]